MTLRFEYAGLHKVISGGQTGADQGGLEAARRLGVETGGTAPLGWRTCRGANPGLATYGLVEGLSHDYHVRTAANIRDSDGTFILARDLGSPGTISTRRSCLKQRKPMFIVDVYTDALLQHDFQALANEAARFIAQYQVEVLNVAGNRDRAENTVMYDFTLSFMDSVMLILKNEGLLVTV